MPAAIPPSRFVRFAQLALLAVISWSVSAPPAGAQQREPFGGEKVETRQFRNREMERAANAKAGPHDRGHDHGHGRKGHKGHKH